MATPQQQANTKAFEFVDKLNDIIIFPTILLLSGIAFLVFLWGCVQYFMNSTSDQAREQGVKHITFGIIGLVVMISAYAILNLAASTFGLGKQLDCANDSGQAGCEDAFVLPDTDGVIPGDGDTGGSPPGASDTGGSPPNGG